MARTDITPTQLAPNGQAADPAGTAGTADGHSITDASFEQLTLRADVATAATDVIIRAGDYPPALSAGSGDLTINCPIGTTWLGPFTSARFAQSDGTMLVNFEAGAEANVTLSAFHMPRTA